MPVRAPRTGSGRNPALSRTSATREPLNARPIRFSEASKLESRFPVRAVAPRYTLVFSEPKTEAGRRQVSLDERTVAALREQRHRQAAERLTFGTGYTDLGLVFAQEDGSPLVPLIFTQRFQKASRDASLPQIRFHDLRHGHVTYLMQAGVPLPAIAQRVGHSSVAVTGDIYSHVRPEVRSDTAAAGAQIVFGAA
jgi:integrase